MTKPKIKLVCCRPDGRGGLIKTDQTLDADDMCREIVAKVRRDYPEAGEAEILTATMERFVAKGEARKTGEGTYIMFVGRLPTTRKEQAS